jgi:hypothetical protein
MPSFQIGGVGLYGDVDTWVNSQNVSGNYSNITVRLNIRSTNTSVSSSGNASLRVNGGQVASNSWGGYGFNISPGQTHTVATWSGNMGHDANGYLSYSIGGSASFSYPGSGGGDWGGYSAGRLALAPQGIEKSVDTITNTSARLGRKNDNYGHGTSAANRVYYRVGNSGGWTWQTPDQGGNGWKYNSISGLTPNTTYSYFSRHWNNNGDTADTGASTFKTLASGGVISVSNLKYNTATINAQMTASASGEANATVKVQYKRSVDADWMDSSTTTSLTPSIVLTGLKPNTSYDYRLVATNSTGTWTGDTIKFKTGNPPGFVFILEEY